MIADMDDGPQEDEEIAQRSEVISESLGEWGYVPSWDPDPKQPDPRSEGEGEAT
jgi:hypothetical protein